MPNPLQAVWDYMRGNDLKARPVEEQKLFYYHDIGAALTVNTLVHGPGATDLLNAARGYGGDGNSAVFACLMALCTAYIEAPARVVRADAEGNRTTLWDHPLQTILDTPNPYMDGLELRWWTQWARHLDGNAYIRKLRSGNETTGNVVELWPISPRLIRPWRDKGSANFIDAYKYAYAPGKFEYIDPANIIHFKLGLDDLDHRLGLAPLKRLVREIATDDEASRFTDALLKNFGIPGLVVQVPKETTLTEEKALELKAKISATFGTGNRGNVGVLTGGAEMSQFGFSPEQLDLRALHYIPETRIAAVMGVPAVVAGLAAGLEKSGQYSNFREAREQFTETKILPQYELDAAKLNTQLRPDFTAEKAVFVHFDTSDMRTLQEDEDKKYGRLNVGVLGKWITVNEARADVGLPPIEGGDTLAAASPVPPLPEPKAGRTLEIKAQDLEQFPDLLGAIVELAEPGFERDLERYFDGQRRRVKRAVLSEPKSQPASEVRVLMQPTPLPLPQPAEERGVVVRKTVTRDHNGRIAEVVERHAQDGPQPWRVVHKDVERDEQGRIARVVERHELEAREESA